jgi:hypothetical protein
MTESSITSDLIRRGLITSENIDLARTILEQLGRADGDLSDEEIVDRAHVLVTAYLTIARAMQPLFETVAIGLADQFRRMSDLASALERAGVLDG